ncbi:hypothetical protein RchiOBHm_Chr2g0149731 [Rosa chinensis]|uniref:Uncharacterized protein n=1 Tax=Rosa chinensis TaxID=74649 RepID=A0A2P6RZU4_ROSCH|nr:hypothetical protein RchiOBHm_Chr2g0149731 [Rosa chinensis]
MIYQWACNRPNDLFLEGEGRSHNGSAAAAATLLSLVLKRLLLFLPGIRTWGWNVMGA